MRATHSSTVQASIYKDFVVSDEQGEFIVLGSFNPTVSWSMEDGHDCSGRPDRLTLVLLSDGHRIRREVITLKDKNKDEYLAPRIVYKFSAPIVLRKASGESCCKKEANKSSNTDTGCAGAG